MIEIVNLCLQLDKFYLNEINLKVEKGQYAILMGETGCGKTSLLEAITGLRPVKSGHIFLNGQDVVGWRPACRGIGYVPQDGSLFPTLTVRENLCFALDVRRISKKESARRIDELAELLDISHLLTRSLKGLSGGERQRVSLGRAIAFEPNILLLDEPLSAVDKGTRESLCGILKCVQEKTGVTVLHVTHSSWEAEKMGEVVFLMKDKQLNPIDILTSTNDSL